MKLNQVAEILEVSLRCIGRIVLLQFMILILVSCGFENKNLELQNKLVSNSKIDEIEESSYVDENNNTPEDFDEKDVVLDYFIKKKAGPKAVENCNFEISDLIEIEEEFYYKIVLTGKLNDLSEYYIGTFAVAAKLSYSSIAGDYRKFYIYNDEMKPVDCGYGGFIYIGITSPNGRYRIETIDRFLDEENIRCLRIIDLNTGDVSWIKEKINPQLVEWSERSSFVAYETHWWYYTDIFIVDMNDFECMELSIKNDFDVFLGHFPYEWNDGDERFLMVDKWLDDSVLKINFQCDSTGGLFHGSYQYDVVNNTITNFEFQEGYLPQE